MTEPVFVSSEADQAERQRKTFRGLGCSAGALAVFGPFILGWQTAGLVPMFIVAGIVFMSLGIAARNRRDRAWLAEANANPGRAHQGVSATPLPSSQLPMQNAQAPNTAEQLANLQDPTSKLNERLAKAKKAGL